jgi:MFS family permease
LAGIISDIYGRKPIFLFSSVILTLASVIAWQYPFYGYILANLAIGPLNNLTFVFIN